MTFASDLNNGIGTEARLTGGEQGIEGLAEMCFGSSLIEEVQGRLPPGVNSRYWEKN